MSRKSIAFARAVKMDILGVIENMSGFVCRIAARDRHLKVGGGEAAAKELGSPFLRSDPIDPRLVIGGDAGQPSSRASGFGGDEGVPADRGEHAAPSERSETEATGLSRSSPAFLALQGYVQRARTDSISAFGTAPMMAVYDDPFLKSEHRRDRT